MEIFYQEIQKMKRVEARKKLIKTYERTKNISKTAKLWGTSRSVVRKSGLKGIKKKEKRDWRIYPEDLKDLLLKLLLI